MGRMKTIAAVAALLAAGTANAQNLLVNGDLETAGFPSASVPFANWDTFTSPAFPLIDPASMDGPSDGTRVGFLAAINGGPGVQGDTLIQQMGIAVTPGTNYFASARALNPSTGYLGDPNTGPLRPIGGSPLLGHAPLLIVDFFDSGGLNVGSAQTALVALDPVNFDNPGPEFTPLDTYVDASFPITAPAGAATANVTLLLVTFGSPGGGVIIDDIFFGENVTQPAVAVNAPTFTLIGTPTTITGNASDPDGSVTDVSLAIGALDLGSVAIDVNGDFSRTLTPAESAQLVEGPNTVTATATDNDNNMVSADAPTTAINIFDPDEDGAPVTAFDILAILQAYDAEQARLANP